MVAFLAWPADEDVFLALRALVLYVLVISLFCFDLFFVSWFSLPSPFLATMSFAGYCSYFHVRFILSAFPVCLFCLVLFGFVFADRARSRFVSVWLRLSRDHS